MLQQVLICENHLFPISSPLYPQYDILFMYIYPNGKPLKKKKEVAFLKPLSGSWKSLIIKNKYGFMIDMDISEKSREGQYHFNCFFFFNESISAVWFVLEFVKYDHISK